MKLWLTTAFFLVFSTGCSWMPFFGDDENNTDEEIDFDTTEAVLYRDSQRSMRSGNYAVAIDGLRMLESRFPFGRYADQAMLEIIYAYYMSVDYDGARASADRFIRLHPQHPDIDYAYYLKGLAAYNKNSGLLDRFFTSDSSKRDITSVAESYADFAQLLARYPTSKYAPDAKQRMIYLRNLLARSELHVANFYMRRGAYVAASNRARYVVESYSKSTAAADALAVMVEANYRLGLEDSANDALRVLAVNFPQYDAFDDSGNLLLAEQVRNRDRSWTNLISFGLLDRPDVPPPLRIQHPEGFVPTEIAQQDPPKDETEDKKGLFSWLPFVD